MTALTRFAAAQASECLPLNSDRAGRYTAGSNGNFHSQNPRARFSETQVAAQASGIKENCVMQDVVAAWNAIKFGGAMVYPLLALGIIAIAIIVDRAVLYARCLRLPSTLADLVETFGFSWV